MMQSPGEVVFVEMMADIVASSTYECRLTFKHVPGTYHGTHKPLHAHLFLTAYIQ